ALLLEQGTERCKRGFEARGRGLVLLHRPADGRELGPCEIDAVIHVLWSTLEAAPQGLPGATDGGLRVFPSTERGERGRPMHGADPPVRGRLGTWHALERLLRQGERRARIRPGCERVSRRDDVEIDHRDTTYAIIGCFLDHGAIGLDTLLHSRPWVPAAGEE